MKRKYGLEIGILCDHLQNSAWKVQEGQESSLNGHNCALLPLILPNLGYLERYTPLNVLR